MNDTELSVHAHETKRFDPMSGSWPVVVFDVIAVLVVTASCFAISVRWAGERSVWPFYFVVGGVVLFAAVALPLRWFLLAQRAGAEAREVMLVNEGHRREFDARLSRALDMAEDEHAALAVAGRALAELAPHQRVDVMLADSSQAHLAPAVCSAGTTAPGDGLSAVPLVGCAVTTPKACPAVRNGHALRFADSDALDACPHLRDRSHGACGAVCVPVSIMGSTVGVLHAVHRPADPPNQRTIAGLEVVAQQLGGRIGLLSAMAQSQMQANTDPLTGLLNRRSLENEVRVLLRKASSFAVVLADLDHFKKLNDTYGHDTGDRALRLFARTLKRSMREHDLVARYGGEEFVVVMPDIDAPTAVNAFDRVRLELEVALSDGRTPAFTVSAGVADTTESLGFDELVGLADAWLLRAKRAGRNQVLWAGHGNNVTALAEIAAPPIVA